MGVTGIGWVATGIALNGWLVVLLFFGGRWRDIDLLFWGRFLVFVGIAAVVCFFGGLSELEGVVDG